MEHFSEAVRGNFYVVRDVPEKEKTRIILMVRKCNLDG